MKMDLRKRRDGLLEAVASEDRDRIGRWKNGTFLECEVKKPNDQKFHSKLICMLRFAFENLPEDSLLARDFDGFRKALLIEAREVEMFPLISGSYHVEAKSLKFGSMDGAERERIYDKLCLVVMDKIMSYKVNREEFDALVANFAQNFMGVSL